MSGGADHQPWWVMRSGREPIVWLSLAWIGGLMTAMQWDAMQWFAARPMASWVLGAAVLVWLIVTLRALWRAEAHAIPLMVGLCMVMLFGAAAAYATWRLEMLPDEHINHYLEEDGILVDVQAVVVSQPWMRFHRPGVLGRFGFDVPRTYFIAEVNRAYLGEQTVPISGRVLAKIPAMEHRLQRGQQIRLQGWLFRFDAPRNPGEYDIRPAMRLRGVSAMLACKSRGNWQRVHEANTEAEPDVRVRLFDRMWHRWVQQREAWRGHLRGALHAGMVEQTAPGSLALLDALLLGHRDESLDELRDSFRHTGLAHLLSISGLHLGIIAAGGWLLAIWITGDPKRAAWAALAIVVLYVLIVPPRIPVLRAAMMTGACCYALAYGRYVTPLGTLTLSAAVLLAWRPLDLYAAGFQLSVGIVAGILLFVPSVAMSMQAHLRSGPMDRPRVSRSLMALRRYGMDYIAVGGVSWLIAWPIVAYHFQIVSPLGFALSIFMLPVVAMILWLGLVKMVLGLFWTGAGRMLAEPMRMLADLAAGVVGWAEDWPGAWYYVDRPDAGWVFLAMAAALVLLLSWRMGAAVRCRVAAATVVFMLLIGQAAGLPTTRAAVAMMFDRGADHRMTLHMIAVGDGSCFIIEMPEAVWAFDCGSAGYVDLVPGSIGPTLRHARIHQIDTLVLSHPDFDHFAAAPELIEQFEIRRVLLTEHFMHEVKANPHSAEAALLKWIAEQQPDLVIETIERGWTEQVGEVAVRAVWPPADHDFTHNNDASIVMRFTLHGGRLMLVGDAQQEAMELMLGDDLELIADVTDLPHHGSFVDASADWITRIRPKVVVQSSGPARLRHDKWAAVLPHDLPRYISDVHGRVTVRMTCPPDADSPEIEVQHHLPEPAWFGEAAAW